MGPALLYAPAKNFIFVHAWKTGGESVVRALREYCPTHFRNRYINKAVRMAPMPARAVLGWRADLVTRQHATAREIQQIMPPEAFDSAFKFAFIRNPWDWQVSQYFYSLQSPAHPLHQSIKDMGSFDVFIRDQHRQGTHTATMFLHDRDGRCLVDYIGRFERIGEDFKTICEKIGIEAELPHVNASKRKRDYHSYYTDETRDMVADLFQSDIEKFGYSWDD